MTYTQKEQVQSFETALRANGYHWKGGCSGDNNRYWYHNSSNNIFVTFDADKASIGVKCGSYESTNYLPVTHVRAILGI